MTTISLISQQVTMMTIVTKATAYKKNLRAGLLEHCKLTLARVAPE